MTYKIYKNGELNNIIVASETFAAEYCTAHGYTYEAVEDTPCSASTDAPTDAERLAALEDAMLAMMGVIADV